MLIRQKLQYTVILVAALLLAILGQRYLRSAQYPIDGFVFYLVGLLLFVRAIGLTQEPIARRSFAPAVRTAGWHLLSLRHAVAWGAAGLVLAVLAFLSAGDGSWTVPTVVFWIAGCIACLIAFWEPRPGLNAGVIGQRLRSWTLTPELRFHLSWVLLGLMLITAVTAFFMFYQLDQVPPEMNSDHAEKLLDIKDILDGKRPIFFPRNTGREPIQFYLTVFWMKLFGWGLSFYALKWNTALLGLLAIPATFLLARELFDSTTGLLAAFCLGVSKWLVTISRMGLRYSLTPLPVALALFFLVRGLRYNRRNDFLLSGVVLGIGLYGYTPIRFLPVAMLALYGLKLLADWRKTASGERVRLIVNLGLAFAVAGVIFAPLGRYMVDHQEMFWYRALTRTSGLERPLPGEAFTIFLDNLKNSLLMFNWRGDVVWVTNVPNDPALDYVMGALFVLGVVYALVRLIRYREVAYAYLLAGILIMLMPSTLSLAFPGENPSLVRSGGALPMVMILVALPVRLALGKLEQLYGRRGLAVGGLATIGLLAVLAQLNFSWYFNSYATQYRQASWNATEMGQVIRDFANSVGDTQHAYLKGWPHWVDHRNVAINMGDITWNNALLDIEQAKAHVADPANKLYLLNVQDQKSVTRLKELFPRGQIREFKSATPGRNFLIFFAPGS